MNEVNGIMYTFNSKIRYTECDMKGFLTLESLVDYFQDCSTFQTQEGPTNMQVLAERGLAWVVNSWQIVINRLPKLTENVTIGTLPYELKGFMGLRNFFMDTDGGERVAVANSVWSLIDLEKSVPSRITGDIEESYPLDEKLPMEYAPRKIKIPSDAGAIPGEVKTIGLHHLDTNNHVNNGQYIRIALQVLLAVSEKEGIEDIKSVAGLKEKIQIRAEYRQQAHLGYKFYPMVYTYKKEKGDTVYAVSLNDEKGMPYSIVEIMRL